MVDIATASTSPYLWQTDIWRALQAMGARRPHALLLHGVAGIGKVDFATRYAQSLLCDRPLAEGYACGVCDACGWFSHYNHPDYRRIRPEALDAAEGAESQEEGESKTSTAAAKVPSKDIRIEQIRALGAFMNVSTHRNGLRVVLIYPAEAMNTAAANALLKMLEEPPPSTLFVLVSHQIDRLLPTIISRCRTLSMPVPDSAVALAWLAQNGLPDAIDVLAENGGAPLAARDASLNQDSDTGRLLADFLASPSLAGALNCAEKLQKSSLSAMTMQQQRWLYDLFLVKKVNIVRYYPSCSERLKQLAAKADENDILRLVESANERRRLSGHPLSARLFLEQMLLEYCTVFS